MLPLDNNRFRSHTTLNGGGNLCDGGISGVVRGEQPDWIKALDPANQDERVVLEAEYFAFYQGALVIRMKGNQGHGFSVGIIVLDEYYGYDDYGIQTLKHEYGHTLHCLQLGLPEYLLKAGIPSVIGYNLDKANIIPKEMYYNLPWERIADMFSNVSRSEHIPGADAVAIIYWLLTLLG